MKSAMAVLAVLLVLSLVLATADISSADDPFTFEEGDFEYHIIEGTNVEITDLDEDYTGLDLVIEPTVTHDAVIYDVVSINFLIENDTIETVTIPSSISWINDTSFNGAMSLETIVVDPSNPDYISDDGVLFEKKNGVAHKMIKCPMNKPGSEYNTIPDTVAEIGTEALGCTGFSTIRLNDGLIKIGDGAFARCFELVNLKSSIGNNRLPESVSIIGSYAFQNCSKLAILNLPNELEYIGPSAFDSSGIITMNIPCFVEFIGEGAFSNCCNLEKFTSDNTDYPIEDDVLYVLGRNDAKSLFAYPAAKVSAKFEIPDDVIDIYGYAFSACLHLEEVVLNDHFSMIPSMAFYDCKSLKIIDISKVSSIGISSFNGCENLTAIEFGKDLISIDDAAFSGCGIQSITIPSNVHYIGYNAFSDCKDLRDVTIEEGSDVKLSFGAFGNDSSIEKISIQSGDVKLSEGSLIISYSNFEPFTLNVEVVKGFEIPSDATNEYTELNITIIGERPYPWENWIGVFFCALIIVGILYGMREV